MDGYIDVTITEFGKYYMGLETTDMDRDGNEHGLWVDPAKICW